MRASKFSKEEIKRRLAMTPPALLMCWICRKEMGVHVYDWPLENGGYTIRIACSHCKRKLEQSGICFYN